MTFGFVINYSHQIYVLHDESESKVEMTISYNCASFARIVLWRRVLLVYLAEGQKEASLGLLCKSCTKRFELLAACFVISSDKFPIHLSMHFLNTVVAVGKGINEIDFV